MEKPLAEIELSIGELAWDGQHGERQVWIEIEGDSHVVVSVLKGVIDIKQVYYSLKYWSVRILK